MIAFDDGPLETTGPILDILKEHGFGATFFVVGERIRGNETLLERMRDEGHEIGNHSHTHARLTELSEAEIWRELDRCHKAIHDATGLRARRFRPPFVAYDDKVLRIAEFWRHEYEVETDTSFGDYNLTADEIVAECDGREVLWLHDGHWPTVEALPAILEMRAAC